VDVIEEGETVPKTTALLQDLERLTEVIQPRPARARADLAARWQKWNARQIEPRW